MSSQEWKPARPQQAYASNTQDRYQQQHLQQGHQGQSYQGQSNDRRDDRHQQYQQQQQEYYPTHSSNVTQFQVNNNAKPKVPNSWASLGLAKAIAAALSLVSIITLAISILGLMRAEEARRALALATSTLPAFPTSSTSWSSRSRSSTPTIDSSIDDFTKSLNAKLDAVYAEVVIFMYVLIAMASLQIIMSIVGFAGAMKRSINMYKAYVYSTAVFLAAWVVMAVLTHGAWVLIVSVIVHAVVGYPLWASVQRWEAMGDEY